MATFELVQIMNVLLLAIRINDYMKGYVQVKLYFIPHVVNFYSLVYQLKAKWI